MTSEAPPPESPEALRLTCRPIGVVRSPFRERAEAPRQTAAARDATGRIELYPANGFEHALEDIELWPYLWVIFWFHLNPGWKPKVLPPRSDKRRGVFATRAPHRPNPLGLSVVKLERVEGLVLHVSALDMLDGTPVLDIKPYVSYADALDDAEGGWLETGLDPQPEFEVVLSPEAERALTFLRERFQVELWEPIRRVLVLGPQRHPYRRIRADGDAFVLAVKDFRARFTVEGRRIVVLAVKSGYRPRELVENPDPALDAHRAFAAEFGVSR